MPTQATVSARRGFLGAQSRRHSRIALANSRPICVRLDSVRNSLGCAARIQRRLIICFHALLTHVLSVITPGMTSGRGRGRDQLRRECEGMTRLLLLWAARGFPSASSYLAWRVGRLDLWRIHSRLMPTCFLTQRYCSALSAQWLGCGLVTKQVKAAGSIACSRAAIRRKPLRPLKQERRTTGANPSLVRPPRSNRTTS